MILKKSVSPVGYVKTFYVLPYNISAIQVIPDAYGHTRIGALLRLPEGARLEINGEGFDDATVRVVWEGSCYYVFREDLEKVEKQKAVTIASH